MAKCGRSFIQGQLQLFLLIIVALYVGFTLCKLYNSYLDRKEQLADHSRWKLFGEEFIYDGIFKRRQQENKAETVEQVRVSARYSANSRVNQLIEGLHNLQVSCYNRRQYAALLYDKYSKFLEVLAIYTEFHVQERPRESTRRLIWICDVYRACGGLADRIKGVTYALTLAILSRRVLLLDWRDSHFGEQAFLQPNMINWQLTEEERNIVYSDDSYYDYSDDERLSSPYKNVSRPASHSDPIFIQLFSILGGIGVDTAGNNLKLSLEKLEEDWEWILLASNMEPSSLMNSTKTASLQWIKQGVRTLGLAELSKRDVDGLVGLVFRYLFKFSEELGQEVDSARSVLGLAGKTYVGVHVRTGFAGSIQQESVRHPKLYRMPYQWDKILTCAHSYATKQLGNKSLLFLATDSNLVKNKTLDTHKYHGRIRTLYNSVIHLDRLEKAPHEADGLEKEGIISTWVELILLAEAYGLVMGESGFSFLAHRLCFIPNYKIIHGLKCEI